MAWWRRFGCAFCLTRIAELGTCVVQDALVAQVASVNSNTIVVVNSVGPINMEAWINHPNGEPHYLS